MNDETKTQAAVENQVEVKTATMERTATSTQSIPGTDALTMGILQAIKVAIDRSTKALDRVDAGVAIGTAGVVFSLWGLAQTGRDYARRCSELNRDKEDREQAVKLFISAIGKGRFETKKGKVSFIYEEKGRQLANLARNNSLLATRLITDNVKLAPDGSGYLHVPGKYLLDKKQLANPEFATFGATNHKIDQTGREGPNTLLFRKSWSRMNNIAKEHFGIELAKKGAENEEASAPIVDFGEALQLVCRTLEKFDDANARPSKELTTLIYEAYARISVFVGATDENATHINVKAANVALASAKRGN